MLSVDLMRRMRYIILLFPLLLLGCGKLPPMFMAHEDAKSKVAKTQTSEAQEPTRQVLEVPPELRGKLSVPMPNKIASAPEPVVAKHLEKAVGKPLGMPTKSEKKAVAGKKVRLDTRMYEKDAASIFSAVVDAMTALNLPVQSVDSPSGIITTGWVRKNENSINASVGINPNSVRFRYVVRILKNEQQQTLLQVRTLGQSFINRHWVNRQLDRKVSEELFSAVEERL